MRLLLAATFTMLLAAPAVAKAPAFKTGTFKGNASTDAPVKIRLYKGTCDIYRQNTTQKTGYCFTLKAFPTLTATCPDGTTRTRDAYPFDVIIKKSGRFSDDAETFGGGPDPLEVFHFEFKAKGKHLTGKARFRATSTGAAAVQDCDSGQIAFDAKL